MRIGDATAVVTGGASGLGEATARHLYGLGARVIIADFNDELGSSLAKELGERALFAHADVTASDQLLAAMDAAVRTFGELHVLINCAGVNPAARTLSRSGPHNIDQFKKAIAVNLVATFDATRLAAEKMALNKPNEMDERGVIINTASTAAFEGQIGQVAYAASKAGIVGMTLVVARDLANYGIRVCSIAPGTFDTPMLRGYSEEIRTALAQLTPFPQRLGRPEEFAMLAAHIIENPMLNGETIRLDGALRMPAK